MRRRNQARNWNRERGGGKTPMTSLGKTRARTAEGDRPFCRFFVLHGHCRFGDSCAYSHEIPSHLTLEEVKKQVPCPYYAKGACRYGDYCQLRHDPSDLPHGSRNIRETPAVSSPVPACLQSQDMVADDNDNELPLLTCGICLEDLPSGVPSLLAGSASSQRKKKFGLLSCCDHVFCLDCVMEWRKKGSQDALGRRSCPTCRKHSDFVIPSSVFPTTNDHKLSIIQEYKDRMSIIPCKRFNGALGSCPFGSDCFYAHCDQDGSDIKAQDRTMEQICRDREERRMHTERLRASMDMLLGSGPNLGEIDSLLSLMRLLDTFGYQDGARHVYEFFSDGDSSEEEFSDDEDLERFWRL